MRDNEWLYRGRLGRFVEELVQPHLYGERHALTVAAWHVPDEPVPFPQAVCQEYTAFAIGSAWGKGWSTTWFHVTGEVPEHLRDVPSLEIVMDLGFKKHMDGSQAEGLAFRPDGTIIKAIEPFNRYLPVEDRHSGRIDLYLEAAANPEVAIGGSWHPTPFSSKATVPDEPIYELRHLDLAVRNLEVWELNEDIEVLAGLVEELPADLPRRAAIVVALNRAMDALDPRDVVGTAARARVELAPVLASPAYASAHKVVATGHAHIDSAWLWPVRETVRKCARTFANVIDLMEQHPEMVFSCSSAQQYAWVKQSYPELWQRLVQKVAEARFVPVGGMWVESDTNMPGSEAMARQLVMGKGFFMRELGVEPLDVWLPDSFGYSGALPQIARAAGSQWFLTQKMSWNETNPLPHHSFLWEGIDGTRIFTHLPPVDTYNSRLAAFELAKAERQYAEQGHGTTSLVPFGYGDGGGGPTREMVAKARRTADLEGSPTVRIGTVEQFFSDAEAELESPAVWVGEMYLETHRGTYTSQLRTKQGNRRNEHLLRAAELWATTASVRRGTTYPTEVLDECWQIVLLQQFHDILPGSSIAWVHREAEANHARVSALLEEIIDSSLRSLVGDGEDRLVANSAPVGLDGVAAFAVDRPAEGAQEHPVQLVETEAGWTVDTGVLTLALDRAGAVTSLVHDGRELVPAGRAFGSMQLHNDRPSMYEAWDIDAHINRVVEDLPAAEDVDIERTGPDQLQVRTRHRVRETTIAQTLTVHAGSAVLDYDLDIDWHEQRTLLRLAFPTTLLTHEASSEIQFGHVRRPTHRNTTWDLARYETCAHRWVHVDEGGYGFAVANDSTYGHSIVRDADSPHGPPGTTVRLSLLRGPRFPDPETDQGRHRMAVRVVCGGDLTAAFEAGQALNQRTRELRGGDRVEPLVSMDGGTAVVESVKLAEDGSGDVVVRIYEARGRRSEGRLRASFDYTAVAQTDLLEREIEATAIAAGATGAGIALAMRAFEIVTLRFSGVGRP